MTSNPPIFESIFGVRQWSQLPSVMHKHYANRPFCNDRVTVEGKMKVEVSLLARLLSPFLRIAGALVPHAGENIPVTVHFRSNPNDNSYTLDRIFSFPDQKPYHFRSRMVPTGADEVVEMMRFGLGWKACFYYDGQKVILEHRGYVMRLFGKFLPLPLGLLLGRGYAEEQALDDQSFRMYMGIHHKLWGQVYAYSGLFSITEMALEQ